jgi:hypothetical protein
VNSDSESDNGSDEQQQEKHKRGVQRGVKCMWQNIGSFSTSRETFSYSPQFDIAELDVMRRLKCQPFHILV